MLMFPSATVAFGGNEWREAALSLCVAIVFYFLNIDNENIHALNVENGPDTHWLKQHNCNHGPRKSATQISSGIHYVLLFYGLQLKIRPGLNKLYQKKKKTKKKHRLHLNHGDSILCNQWRADCMKWGAAFYKSRAKKKKIQKVIYRQSETTEFGHTHKPYTHVRTLKK